MSPVSNQEENNFVRYFLTEGNFFEGEYIGFSLQRL